MEKEKAQIVIHDSDGRINKQNQRNSPQPLSDVNQSNFVQTIIDAIDEFESKSNQI